jgi:hypothetical protein
VEEEVVEVEVAGCWSCWLTAPEPELRDFLRCLRLEREEAVEGPALLGITLTARQGMKRGLGGEVTRESDTVGGVCVFRGADGIVVPSTVVRISESRVDEASDEVNLGRLAIFLLSHAIFESFRRYGKTC